MSRPLEGDSGPYYKLTYNALSFDLPVTLLKSEAFSRFGWCGSVPLKRLGLESPMLLRRATQAKLALHASGSATLR